MKRFWTIFAVALVALGVTACSEGADEQAAPKFEGVSFYASVNTNNPDARTVLEKDENGVWNTIWEGNETLIANVNWMYTYYFTNSPAEPNKFTCTDESILEHMVDGPVSANIYNANAEWGPNSAKGADGISFWGSCMLGSGNPAVLDADCAILRYSSDFEVTFTTTAKWMPGYFGDGTDTGFTTLTLPAGKDILVPIFSADLAGGPGTLSYAINGETVGTMDFTPATGMVYNLGTLQPKGHSVYVYNDSKWSNIYIYTWEDGVADSYPTGAWPGSAMTKTTVGEVEYYKYELPGALNGKKICMIFNNNNGAQTADITATVNGDLYYLSSGGVIEDPANPVPPQTYKIYAYNYAGWSTLYLYSWDSVSSANYAGTWPGTKVTETEVIGGHTYYVYQLPATATNQSIKVIYSNGNGAQTADSEAIKLDKDVYVRINVAAVTVLDDPNNPEAGLSEGEEARSIYVTTTLSWSKMNLYTWSPELKGWPGTAMTKVTLNDQTWWKLDLAAGYNGITFGGMIFNNGSAQTVDITSGTKLDKDLFFRIETTQSGGKYKVTAVADPRQ